MVSFSFAQNDKSAMAGLYVDAPNAAELKYAICGRSDGTIEIFEDGQSVVLEKVFAYVPTDVFTVRRVGQVVQFLQNSTVLRTVTPVLATRLRVGVKCYEVGAKIEKFRSYGGLEPLILKEAVNASIYYLQFNETVKVYRTSGAAAWNSGGIGVHQLLGDGFIEFSLSASGGRTAVGLAETDPDRNYTAMSYAVVSTSTGSFRIYENNVQKYDSGSVHHSVEDVFRIQREGQNIRYFRNGVEIPLSNSNTLQAGKTLLIDTALCDPDTSITLFGISWRDRDSDGIDDEWEMAHFGGITISDGTLDGDSDGFTDVSEFFNSQDPNSFDFPGAPVAPVTPPAANCRLWLKAETGIVTYPTGLILNCQDQSSSGNDLSPVIAQNQAVSPPSVQNGGSLWNNRYVLRFDGISNRLRFANGTFGMSSPEQPIFHLPVTGCEVFIALKADTDSPNVNRPLWQTSSGSIGYYPSSSTSPAYPSSIRDKFVSSRDVYSSFMEVGNPAQPLDIPHVYNIVSRPSLWQARINGRLLYSTTDNLGGFPSDAILGGGDEVVDGFFKGDVAEILVYDRELTDAERRDIYVYLAKRYKMMEEPPPPTNFVAQPISKSQALLTWKGSTNAGRQEFKIERRTGSSSDFFEVAKVADTESFIDSGLTPDTEYQYRISAENYVGDSNAVIYPTFFTPESDPNFETSETNPNDMLRVWLRADEEITPVNGLRVGRWRNIAKDANSGEQAVQLARPIYISEAFGNHRPGIYWDGGNGPDGVGDSLGFPNYTFADYNEYTPAGGRDVFIVVKAEESLPGVDRPLWSITSNTYYNRMAYPAPDGSIYDGLYSEREHPLGMPVNALTSPNIYNVTVKTGLWEARLNGKLQYSTVTVPNQGGTYVPYFDTSGALGSSENKYFKGHIAEFLVYNRPLNADQRQGVLNYLGRKYAIGGIPSVPSGLAAKAISQNQVLVSWPQSVTDLSATYILERKTGAGNYTLVTSLTDVGSFLDSGLQADTTYSYRLKVRNSRGESPYSGSVNVKTPAGGFVVPTYGMRLWLKADSLSQVQGARVNYWADESGLGNYLRQNTVAQQPTVELSAINGRSAVRFNGSNSNLLFKNMTFGNLSAGEIFAVLKADQDDPINPDVDRGLWTITTNISLYPSFYPAANGNITESFGAGGTYYSLGNPERPLDSANLYNVCARNNFWMAQLNGFALKTDLTRPVGGFSTSGTLGVYHTAYFAGVIAEIIAYDHVLTQAERDGVRNYLGWKYGEVAIHGDLDADGDGLSTAQEIATGADPNASDSNNDGIWDGSSQNSGYSPISDNPDNDGLTNAQELLLGTDPFQADTDGDGHIDGWNGALGHDVYPLDPTRWMAPVGDTTPPVITLTNPPLGTL